MPDLNATQFTGWGERDNTYADVAPPRSAPKRSNQRERNRSDARVAQHAHDTAKEAATKGYKTEGRAYDRDNKRPTVTGYEKSKKSYEDSQRYNDV